MARGLAAVCVIASSLVVSQPGAPALESLLNRYDRADFDAAVRGIRQLPVSPKSVTGGTDHVALDPLFLDWIAFAPGWIASAKPEAAARRRLVAASFALELAWSRTSAHWYFRYPFVAWACDVLRQSPTRLAGERWWHLAAIGVLEENEDWAHVMGGQWTQLRATMYLRRTPRMFFGKADLEEATTGHLAHAKAAVPEEVRWHIAGLHYDESTTFLDEAIGPLGIGGHQTSQARLDLLVKAAAGARVDPRDGPVTRASATTALDKVGRLTALEQRYVALNALPSLRGDVALRLGFLRLRQEDWDAALGHLREVPRLTKEPALVSLSHHLTGWILQQTGKRDAAIDAYRQALARTPRARSTSILLAAQLLGAGRQADAYTVMHEALAARPAPATFPADTIDAPLDPWALYPRGDALLLPTFMARLREALR